MGKEERVEDVGVEGEERAARGERPEDWGMRDEDKGPELAPDNEDEEGWVHELAGVLGDAEEEEDEEEEERSREPERVVTGIVDREPKVKTTLGDMIYEMKEAESCYREQD